MDEVQVMGAGRIEYVLTSLPDLFLLSFPKGKALTLDAYREMVSLIPRISSWAVSGTPARVQVADLMHVLRFLRINYLVEPPRVWARLLSPPFAREFKQLFQKVAIR